MPPVIAEKPSVLAPKIAEQPLEGVRHVCLDIETQYAPKEGRELSQRFWRPPSNIKDPDKIEARRLEDAQRLERDSALLDSAPVACVAIQTDRGGAIFNSVKAKKAISEIRGVPAVIHHAASEKAMLVEMRAWLDARVTPGTVLIGFNVYDFDLPKLRGAYVRHRLRLPILFQPEADLETYDVMRKFIRYFSAENAGERHVKLAEVEARLGLPEYKNRVTGAEVPGMLEKGLVREVLTYCWLDTASTYFAFLAMTGQYQDQGEH